MASKRSRATFEADLQVQQSSFVVYGTPLPPLDESIRDDGSYVPVWKQEVTDEQGRKRLHGAFTGGFSAGYFNTVGSQEGWTPSTFVSSRTNRKRDAPQEQQRPEDFMDDEDRADAEEAKKLQTADTFAGLGPVDERPSSEPFMDLMKTTGETMGVRLLKKMGWRDGQGVGPKIRRKARLEEDQLLGVLGGQDATTETHLFAPANSNIIAFVRKKDRKGLGYDDQTGIAKIENETVESKSTHLLGVEEDMDGRIGTLTMKNKPRKKKKEGKGGIGIGILNDTGSDDEDPYSMGPSISYNRVIGGDKKKKKKVEAVRSSANPLLSSKPIFISKKAGAAKGSSGLRRCHDGRLPLDGFVLSSDPDPRNSIVSQDGKFPPPKIPEDWKSSRSPSNAAASTSVQNSYQSAARVAAAAKLSPKSRAALLGEVQLPGKSVFDYLNPAARNRIASATNNYNLPPALSEADSKSSGASTKTLASLVPQLARETALTALGRGTAGWMPYAEDSGKRARYRTFLEIRASLRPEGTLPERAPGASNDDWINEMNEFAHAAEIFKPMTGAMASRFTSSSSTPKLASDNVKLEGVTDGTKDPPLITQHPAKSKTPAEEAAAVGMYGPLTRSVENFYPSRLLCKRFNVKPPSHVQMDPSDAPLNGSTEGESRDGKGPPLTHSTALPQKRLELVGKKDMDELRMSGGGMPQVERALSAAEQAGIATAKESIAVDPERNEALEKERPGEAVFRAIFGSDTPGVAFQQPSPRNQQTTIKLSATRDSSDGSSVSDKLSIRASVLPCDADPPYLEESSPVYQPTAASSSTLPSHAPPPFSSLYFPSQASPDRLKVLEPDSGPPPAFSPAPTPPPETAPATSRVEAETKAALPRDTKAESSSKSAEESEPPPPYTEGSSPLDSFTYVMAATGGPASIITQVSQGGPAAPGNSLAGRQISITGARPPAKRKISDVGADEHITLDLRGTRFTLSRDELLTLPEFVLLSLFPNGLLPDGHMNSFHEGDIYPVDYDPKSLEYMLQFFRDVAQTIPSSSPSPTGASPSDPATSSQDPSSTSARDMLQDRAGIIVLREDLDFYAIPHKADIDQTEMMEVKRAAGQALLAQNGIFSGLRRSEETGTTEQHLIEMLTAGGFYNEDTWGHRAGEPHKAVICSLALARLRTDVKGNENLANSSAVGMAQKLLLFWRKPARRCWWEGVELENVDGIEGKLKVWIRRVWTLEMSVIGLR